MTPDASPLFVFGAAHSGTTILYRMLAYHPQLAWLSQFSMRGGEIPGRGRVPGAGRLDKALRSIPHQWRKEESTLRRVVVPLPAEGARSIWHYLLEDGNTDAQRVRSCLTAFTERLGGRRLLAKRPDFYRFLGLLHAAFPDALFVHIVRDGRPVAFSLRAKYEQRFEDIGADLTVDRGTHRVDPPHSSHKRKLARDDALATAARHWVAVMERAHATPGIDLLEARYEDLCEDAHGVIETVLARAGLEVESFPFARCPPKLSQRNSRWIEGATPEELAAVSEIQRDLLLRYAYPLE